MTAAELKPFATLQATLALHGVALVRTTDDREQPLYVASRAELCKSFGSLDQLRDWLHRTVGATND